MDLSEIKLNYIPEDKHLVIKSAYDIGFLATYTGEKIVNDFVVLDTLDTDFDAKLLKVIHQVMDYVLVSLSAQAKEYEEHAAKINKIVSENVDN